MNKRIYNLQKNDINSYESTISAMFGSTNAIFHIFDGFFHELLDKEEIAKKSGIKLKHIINGNMLYDRFNLIDDSLDTNGISFIYEFDGHDYCVKFRMFRDGDRMLYEISLKSLTKVNYSGDFIYKYLLYNALESSKLKGAYFTMPRDRFDWDIKTIENRTFNDIFLPSVIMEDLHLFVNIYKENNRVLRYLKVGPAGVGKTESTLVMANELNKLGVTIIKTPICELLHQKIELANVLAPTLIIFDDIDLSLGDRNKGVYSRLLGDFLDVLDGTDKLSKDVGIIATTNAAHLLDLAAQRPGRFDKTLLFDNITKDNIKNIIIKSLAYNFNITNGKELELYTNKRIINKFYDGGVTGSHVYNSIKMLKLRYDTLKVEHIDVKKILESIDNELLVINKVRKISQLTDKYDRSVGKMGFGSKREDDDEDEDNFEDHEVETEFIKVNIRESNDDTFVGKLINKLAEEDNRNDNYK